MPPQKRAAPSNASNALKSKVEPPTKKRRSSAVSSFSTSANSNSNSNSSNAESDEEKSSISQAEEDSDDEVEVVETAPKKSTNQPKPKDVKSAKSKKVEIEEEEDESDSEVEIVDTPTKKDSKPNAKKVESDSKDVKCDACKQIILPDDDHPNAICPDCQFQLCNYCIEPDSGALRPPFRNGCAARLTAFHSLCSLLLMQGLLLW